MTTDMGSTGGGEIQLAFSDPTREADGRVHRAQDGLLFEGEEQVQTYTNFMGMEFGSEAGVYGVPERRIPVHLTEGRGGPLQSSDIQSNRIGPRPENDPWDIMPDGKVHYQKRGKIEEIRSADNSPVASLNASPHPHPSSSRRGLLHNRRSSTGGSVISRASTLASNVPPPPAPHKTAVFLPDDPIFFNAEDPQTGEALPTSWNNPRRSSTSKRVSISKPASRLREVAFPGHSSSNTGSEFDTVPKVMVQKSSSTAAETSGSTSRHTSSTDDLIRGRGRFAAQQSTRREGEDSRSPSPASVQSPEWPRQSETRASSIAGPLSSIGAGFFRPRSTSEMGFPPHLRHFQDPVTSPSSRANSPPNLFPSLAALPSETLTKGDQPRPSSHLGTSPPESKSQDPRKRVRRSTMRPQSQDLSSLSQPQLHHHRARAQSLLGRQDADSALSSIGGMSILKEPRPRVFEPSRLGHDITIRTQSPMDADDDDDDDDDELLLDNVVSASTYNQRHKRVTGLDFDVVSPGTEDFPSELAHGQYQPFRIPPPASPNDTDPLPSDSQYLHIPAPGSWTGDPLHTSPMTASPEGGPRQVPSPAVHRSPSPAPPAAPPPPPPSKPSQVKHDHPTKGKKAAASEAFEPLMNMLHEGEVLLDHVLTGVRVAQKLYTQLDVEFRETALSGFDKAEISVIGLLAPECAELLKTLGNVKTMLEPWLRDDGREVVDDESWPVCAQHRRRVGTLRLVLRRLFIMIDDPQMLGNAPGAIWHKLRAYRLKLDDLHVKMARGFIRLRVIHLYASLYLQHQEDQTRHEAAANLKNKGNGYRDYPPAERLMAKQSRATRKDAIEVLMKDIARPAKASVVPIVC